jgi:hypothetical protein
MNILADFHHNDLYHSLQLLFENRLEHSLFRPIGMEWAEEGWWQIHKPYNYNPETARQYLQIKPGYIPNDATLVLNTVRAEAAPGLYVIEDIHNGVFQRAITLQNFKEMPIDLIIASIPDHWKSFTQLRNKYKPDAKIICQMGNHFAEVSNMVADGTIRNLMASTSPFSVPNTVNAVFYHQEFSTDIFTPSTEAITKQITSFINVYHANGGSSDYYALKSIMPDYTFNSYGASCDNGVVNTTKDMAAIMRKTQWGFHVKYGGDGYGHVLYNWFACGTPVITRMSDYKGKLGEELLTHMETCIDLDQVSLDEGKQIIENMTPNRYISFRQSVATRFRECVDFHLDTEKIRIFLENLD